MKYVIEIEDEPFGRNDDSVIPHGMDELYRAKGFNALVFDKYVLEKLTPLDKELEEAYQKGFEAGQHEATTIEYQKGFDDAKRISEDVCQLEYNKGLNDAWNAAKKIFGYECDGGLPVDELRNAFGFENGPFCTADILRTNTASEAIKKLREYEEQQKADEIKVGDEITTAFGNGVVVRKYMGKDGVERCEYWHYENVQIYHDLTFSLRKTGRHFPQVAELLKAMKEGAE